MDLDDPTSFAYLRIGKCYEKLGLDELALKNYRQTVHEDPLLDKGWIAITDFFFKKKNYQKALYYINKAINIDGENVLYWKRYARINNKLQRLEEAERGYRRSLELGNYELETWIKRCDILIDLVNLKRQYKTCYRLQNSTRILLRLNTDLQGYISCYMNLKKGISTLILP